MLVRDKRILATGYNGAPRGTAHCLEVGCLREQLGIPSGERQELCRAIHAEQNAIIQAAIHGVAIEGATLYTHAAPLHPVRQDAHQLRRPRDPLPRGLPGRALARRCSTRPASTVHQGGAPIDGLMSLSSPTAHGRAGLLLAAVLVFLLTPLMSRLARAHRRASTTPPTSGACTPSPRRCSAASACTSAGSSPVLLLVPVDRPVWGIIGGVTIVVAVGLFDDLYELEPIVKFIGQLLAIGVAIYFDIRITRVAVPFTGMMIALPAAGRRCSSRPSGWRRSSTW